MKKLLLLLLVASLVLNAQAQRVYPTKIVGLNALVYVPAGADTTRAMNAYIFTPGAGEQGTNIALLYNHGPFLYAKNGGVDMKTASLIFAIQNVNANPRPSEIDSYITAICKLYNINKIILTGLSRGGQNSEWYANDTIRQSNIRKLAGLIVFSSQGTVTGYSDAPAPFNANWFAQNNIPILRGEGDQDFTWPQNYSAHTALYGVAPKLDVFGVWPGAGHGDPVWSDGYNPAPPSTSPIYKLLNGKSSYQWGDSIMGTIAPPVVYSNSTQSATYVKTCSCGVPDSVVYTVPAGKYTSTVSQAMANQLASADMTANGQTYANTTGVCAPVIILTIPLKNGTTFTLYSDGSGTIK